TYLPTYLVIGFYFLLNICYCLKLKQYAIIDVFIIATGFVLRVIVGGVSTGIYLSPWIILMTFLLALFLAFAKRRDDIVIYNNNGEIVRKNITAYNLDFLNQIITIIATLAVVCYLMYSMSNDVVERLGEYSYITIIFVIAGFIRYLQLTIVREHSGSPTKVLMQDRFIQTCILLWAATFGVLIYI
ncbi:MAG: prenyltransferase, partial [Rikenellaceae bacterium]